MGDFCELHSRSHGEICHTSGLGKGDMVVGYVFWEADAEKELGVYKVYWEVRSTIPGLGGSPGEGTGYPLQYEFLLRGGGGGGAAQVTLLVKNPPTNAGDRREASSMPGSGRSPGKGNGNPLQCSCLENLMDREAWQLTVGRVAKR